MYETRGNTMTLFQMQTLDYSTKSSLTSPMKMLRNPKRANKSKESKLHSQRSKR